MIEPRCTVEIAQAGTKMHDKNLAEEMMELRKVWTAVMMDKCHFKNEAVACPKPRRRHIRLHLLSMQGLLQYVPATLSFKMLISRSRGSQREYTLLSTPCLRGLRWHQSETKGTKRPDEGMKAFQWEELFYSSIEKHW